MAHPLFALHAGARWCCDPGSSVKKSKQKVAAGSSSPCWARHLWGLCVAGSCKAALLSSTSPLRAQRCAPHSAKLGKVINKVWKSHSKYSILKLLVLLLLACLCMTAVKRSVPAAQQSCSLLTGARAPSSTRGVCWDKICWKKAFVWSVYTQWAALAVLNQGWLVPAGPQPLRLVNTAWGRWYQEGKEWSYN